MERRSYFEYTFGGSFKFYLISLDEAAGTYTTTYAWGRIGTAGQAKVAYRGPDEAAALAAFVKGENERIGRGYLHPSDPAGLARAAVATAGTGGASPIATLSAAQAVPATTSVSGVSALPRVPAQLAGAHGELSCAIADPAHYVVEEKFDGFRGLLKLERGSVSLLNREGLEKGRTVNAPALAAALTALADADPELWAGTILDGELVGESWNDTAHLLGGAGRSASGLRYIVFDLPFCAGIDLRPRPWGERRAILESRFAALSAPAELSILLTPTTGVVEAIWERGGEGVIIKDRLAPYVSGDRSAWSKVKREQSAEGVILGFDAGSGKNVAAFGSLILGQYRDGALTEVARISGMTDAVRNSIDASWIGACVEFLFHEKTESRYRHPRWLRARPDKTPRDCVWESS
jgi:bifunctional non-homologous end joining protein LigD